MIDTQEGNNGLLALAKRYIGVKQWQVIATNNSLCRSYVKIGVRLSALHMLSDVIHIVGNIVGNNVGSNWGS